MAEDRTPARALIDTVWRYGLVGVANTLIGLAVILAFQFGLGASPYLANGAGYLAGWGLGYLLSRRFVFASSASARRTGPRYVLAVALAYGLNLLVLATARAVLPSADLFRAAGQLAAMGSYTVVLFLLSRYFVFASGATTR